MIQLRTCIAALLLGGLSGGPAGSPSSAVAVGSVAFEQRMWGTGSLPSVTFTVSPGRGPLEKVLAYLYVSDVPGAFENSPYPPQFVGEFVPPASMQVLVDRSPERGPITPFSHEKFVQGALIDAHTGTVLSTTNEDYLDIVYESAPETFALDFETEDDFTTPLVNGQDLSTPPEFGRLVSLSALQPASGLPHFGPAAFDSSPLGPNLNAEDQDLLVDSGNLIILQENNLQTVAGIFRTPDDSANGGTLVFDFTGFDFTEKVEPRSIDLVDIDSGSQGGVRIVLTDVLGRKRTYTVPAGWTQDLVQDGLPGFGTLDLTTLAPQPGFLATATATQAIDYIPGEVVRMEIELGGSGAIDNLVFSREADPGTKPARVLGRGTGARPK